MEQLLTVYRDPHGRPCILISRGRVNAHLIGRGFDGIVKVIEVPLRDFDTKWAELEYRGNAYPPIRAARYWLNEARRRKTNGLPITITDRAKQGLRDILNSRKPKIEKEPASLPTIELEGPLTDAVDKKIILKRRVA